MQQSPEILQGSSLRRKAYNSKWPQEAPELTRFTRCLPPRVRGKDCSDTSRQTKLPERGLDQPSHLERTLFNLLSYLQVVQCASGPQLLWAVTNAGVNFSDAVVLYALTHQVGLWYHLYFGGSWAPYLGWGDVCNASPGKEVTQHSYQGSTQSKTTGQTPDIYS